MGRPTVLALVALVAGLTVAAGASPVAAADSSYRRSVEDALTIVRAADRTQPEAAATEADAVLRTGTGDSQPEILADLERRPPDLDDARARLEALDQSLSDSAPSVDGDRAHTQINSILAQSRYDSLRGGQSIVQRIEEYLLYLLLQLLFTLFSHAGSNWAVVVAVVLGLAVLAFAGWLGWELARRSRREPALAPAAARKPDPRDFFAEADRLAARGELGAAIVALAGGVAASLAGEEAWDRSPLTVRELFRRAPAADRLRPLLLAFEGVSYGERTADAEDYASAAAVASDFRPARP